MSCRKWQVQIFRWHEGWLDRESETALLSHLSTCAHCRSVADRSSEISRLLVESHNPSVPPFLKERIVSRVIEDMRQDSFTRAFRHFTTLFAHFRPALVGIILVMGIGLGVFAGSSLSRWLNIGSPGSAYDVLALAGMESGGIGTSLDFVWTETQGGAQ